MGFSWPFGRHARWQKQLDAYLDGELSAGDLRRFETHLSRCARCEHELAARRDLKRMAATLPQLPAPRSFRITPGMLGEAPTTGRSRRAPVVMRLAQVTAGLATVAFAAVLVADLSRSGDTNQQRASSEDAAQPQAADAAQDAPVTGDTSTHLDSASSTALPELDSSAVSGAGAAPSPTNSSLYGDQASRNSTTTAGQPADDSSQAGEESPPATDEGVASSKGLEPENEDGGVSGFAIAEIALFALGTVAVGTWVVTRRRAS